MITAEQPTGILRTMPPLPAIEPPFSLRSGLLGLVLVVAAFDLCFWGVHGYGLFRCGLRVVLAGAIMVNRGKTTGAALDVVLALCWRARAGGGDRNGGDEHPDAADRWWPHSAGIPILMERRGMGAVVFAVRGARLCARYESFWLAARLHEAGI